MNVPYVLYCDDEIIKLEYVPKSLKEDLIRMGGRKGKTSIEMVLPIKSEEDRISLFSTLRDKGFAFSGGRDWCPADQFAELRDKGKLFGRFKCIVWRGPGDSVIIDM